MKEIFNTLPGKWLMERHIQNGGNVGMLTGTCTFSEMEDGRLLCTETGKMDINGYQTDSTRSYIYEYQNGRILIIYNDPHRKDEILHELEFLTTQDGAVATHCHLCGADTYNLTFTLLADDKIQMDYVVNGPHKDYAMQTTLNRQI